ncbi:hypothetical protein D3C86_1154710 [compost metagenome]
MNHKAQQQFGERYDISEHGDVIGVIVHVTGTVTNDENEAHVRVFNVAGNGKPGTEIQHGHVHFHDLNLDGSATVVMLDGHAHVHDGVFATFDIGDYAHGGYEGDTIGVLYAPDGSRQASDLSTLYRNIIQEHSHGAAVWSDFYTGNNTPVATHFAIYPIVEFEHGHLGINEVVSNGILSFSSPYPNPASGNMAVPFQLTESSEVSLSVSDLTGKELISMNPGRLAPGTHEQILDLSSLTSGQYIVVVKTTKGSLATKISKM